MSMKRIGLWLIILGLGSFVLSLVNFNFLLLSWVDSWGKPVGYGLRLAVAALGFYWYRTSEN